MRNLHCSRLSNAAAAAAVTVKLAVETLPDSKERAGRDGHSDEHLCTSQEMDANALAKAINPEMELCQRMGNPENPTRA